MLTDPSGVNRDMEGLERTKKGPEYEVKYSALWSCGVLLFHSFAGLTTTTKKKTDLKFTVLHVCCVHRPPSAVVLIKLKDCALVSRWVG